MDIGFLRQRRGDAEEEKIIGKMNDFEGLHNMEGQGGKFGRISPGWLRAKGIHARKKKRLD
jgi:hypothetical protein